MSIENLSSKKYKIILYILLFFFMNRGFMLFEGYLGKNIFAGYTKPPVYKTIRQSGWESTNMVLPAHLKNTSFFHENDVVKFDAGYYLRIATIGYDKFRMNEKHRPADWVFFPMYPLVLRLAKKLLPFLRLSVIGLILSNLFFAVSLIYIYKICCKKNCSHKEALSAILFLLIYPSSIYFSIPYTESLFLLLSSLSVFYTLDKKFFPAIVFAALSTVTRVPGFINVFFVLASMVFQKDFKFDFKSLSKLSIYGLISVIPLTAYFWYLKVLTGDFFAALHEQALNWGRHTTIPLINYFRYFKNPYFIMPGGWDNGLISFVMATAVFAFYLGYFIIRIKKYYNDRSEILFFLYGLLLLVIPFSTADVTLSSTVRYMMVSLPLYVYLGKASASHIINYAYTLLFFSLNVIITIAFFNNYFFVV